MLVLIKVNELLLFSAIFVVITLFLIYYFYDKFTQSSIVKNSKQSS